MRALLVLTLLASPLHALTVDDAAIDRAAGGRAEETRPVAAQLLDSRAQSAMKKISMPESAVRPLRVADAEKSHPDLITRLEEIRVYGRNETEDYVGPKKSPMMQFRARLEKDVPLTPAKKAQLALCLIGLCGIYGPDGIPEGDSPEARADARLYQSTSQLNAQFRGTLQ